MAHEYDDEARDAYDNKTPNEFSAAASTTGPLAGPSNQEEHEEYDAETVEKVYRLVFATSSCLAVSTTMLTNVQKA